MTVPFRHTKDVFAGLDTRRLCNRLAGTASSPQTADRLAGSRRGGDGPRTDIPNVSGLRARPINFICPSRPLPSQLNTLAAG